jgi:hypothetical protein
LAGWGFAQQQVQSRSQPAGVLRRSDLGRDDGAVFRHRRGCEAGSREGRHRERRPGKGRRVDASSARSQSSSSQPDSLPRSDLDQFRSFRIPSRRARTEVRASTLKRAPRPHSITWRTLSGCRGATGFVSVPWPAIQEKATSDLLGRLDVLLEHLPANHSPVDVASRIHPYGLGAAVFLGG